MAHTANDTSTLRQEIAHRAAKLIVEENLHDLALAKRKAARHLATHEERNLPSDQEVEEAVLQYRLLYRPEHGAVLIDLRRKALAVMHFLGQFQPSLTGPLLTGNADAHSEIHLIVGSDDPKSVEYFLLNQQIEYQHRENAHNPRDAEFPILAFWYDETRVLLHVRPSLAKRRPHEEQASFAQVEQLLNASTEHP